MSKEAWLILQHFSEHPFINITKRGKSLKMSARKFDDAKQELIRAELVEEANITWGDGDPKPTLSPTDKGLSLLESLGCDVRFWSHTAYQGFEHRLHLCQPCNPEFQQGKALCSGQTFEKSIALSSTCVCILQAHRPVPSFLKLLVHLTARKVANYLDESVAVNGVHYLR